MYANNVYPLKTLEEMQRDAMKRNNEEADRICKNCFLFIGWSGILIFICYVLIFVIVTLINTQFGGGNEQLVIIEEYFTGSMSGSS